MSLSKSALALRAAVLLCIAGLGAQSHAQPAAPDIATLTASEAAAAASAPAR